MAITLTMMTAKQPGRTSEKRPRDDNDYELGSDYFHRVFDTDWATVMNLTDLDAIMQQRMAQEQAKEDWQENHDRLFGPNKKHGEIAIAPSPEVRTGAPGPTDGLETTAAPESAGDAPQTTEAPGPTGGQETTDAPVITDAPETTVGPETTNRPETTVAPETTEENPETRRRNEEIDRVFNPIVERFRRIESIKRRPAATTKGRKSGQTGKKVKFSVDVPGAEDAPSKTTKTTLLGPTLPASTPTTSETPAERFGPHPLLPRTDQDFEDALCTLRQMMRDWTREYFYHPPSEAERRDFNLYRLAQGSPELMKHAAWIAAGGNLEKWKSHFLGHRSELVFGVLGKMLEVEVFGHTMFGATPSQLATLTQMDLTLLKVDGFKRTRVRSRMIKTLLDRSIVPPDFDAQVQELAIRFFAMIAPLIPPSVARTLWIPTTTPTTPPPPPFLPASTNTSTAPTAATTTFAPAEQSNPLLTALWAIIDHAAKTSLDMRREETIYYVSAPAKGSVYEDESMACMNRAQIKRQSDWKEDGEVPLVRLVGFPGVVAYRAGNGREGGEEEGLRCRRVSRAEVVLEWGVERVVGSGNGKWNGNGDGRVIANGNGTENENGNGNGNGNGNRELSLKEAIAKSKGSASWVYGLLDRITPWAR